MEKNVNFQGTSNWLCNEGTSKRWSKWSKPGRFQPRFRMESLRWWSPPSPGSVWLYVEWNEFFCAIKFVPFFPIIVLHSFSACTSGLWRRTHGTRKPLFFSQIRKLCRRISNDPTQNLTEISTFYCGNMFRSGRIVKRLIVFATNLSIFHKL